MAWLGEGCCLLKGVAWLGEGGCPLRHVVWLGEDGCLLRHVAWLGKGGCLLRSVAGLRESGCLLRHVAWLGEGVRMLTEGVAWPEDVSALFVASLLEEIFRSESETKIPGVSHGSRNDTQASDIESLAEPAAGDIGQFSTGWVQSVLPAD